MARPDVTVLGAGIFGLSIAWACLKRGAKVQVIDPHGPAAGASGGVVGALAPHVPENWNQKKAFQLESLLMAEKFWAGVDDASGLRSGYGRLGRLQPILDARGLELARERTENARALWQGQAIWEVVSDPQEIWVPAAPTGFYIRDTLSARIHPRRACQALAKALEARGAQISTEGREAGSVVHATGVDGLKAMFDSLDKPVGNGVKGQGALISFAAPTSPQLFIDGVHIVPHADGTTAIGSTSERDYDDPVSTDSQLDDLIEKVAQIIPTFRQVEVQEKWAALRPRTKSRAPMLGRHPLFPEQFIANGGFKIGFGMAPKIAEVMADLVLENQDNIPQDFRPEASL